MFAIMFFFLFYCCCATINMVNKDLQKQEAQLSQRGRAMLRVCLFIVSFNIPTAQFFITSYCGFRFTSA